MRMLIFADKVEKILKGSLGLIPSPSPSVKIQIMGKKFDWGVKAKLSYQKIWIFTEGEGDGIESRQGS